MYVLLDSMQADIYYVVSSLGVLVVVYNVILRTVGILLCRIKLLERSGSTTYLYRIFCFLFILFLPVYGSRISIRIFQCFPIFSLTQIRAEVGYIINTPHYDAINLSLLKEVIKVSVFRKRKRRRVFLLIAWDDNKVGYFLSEGTDGDRKGDFSPL